MSLKQAATQHHKGDTDAFQLAHRLPRLTCSARQTVAAIDIDIAAVRAHKDALDVLVASLRRWRTLNEEFVKFFESGYQKDAEPSLTDTQILNTGKRPFQAAPTIAHSTLAELADSLSRNHFSNGQRSDVIDAGERMKNSIAHKIADAARAAVDTCNQNIAAADAAIQAAKARAIELEYGQLRPLLRSRDQLASSERADRAGGG